MNRYYIGHAIVAALGFLTGVVLAMSISPGDALLLIGMGIVFGFSAWALFDQNFGSDWWSFGRPACRKTWEIDKQSENDLMLRKPPWMDLAFWNFRHRQGIRHAIAPTDYWIHRSSRPLHHCYKRLDHSLLHL
jgi:hypothetical protein